MKCQWLNNDLPNENRHVGVRWTHIHSGCVNYAQLPPQIAINLVPRPHCITHCPAIDLPIVLTIVVWPCFVIVLSLLVVSVTVISLLGATADAALEGFKKTRLIVAVTSLLGTTTIVLTGKENTR